MSRASDDPARGGALARAHALADPTRASIHRMLESCDRSFTITELATAAGVHRTAAGQHLTVLVDAGLAVRTTRSPTGRGRPALAYRAVEAEPYRRLASWLAEAVRTGTSARQIGRNAGEATPRAADDPISALMDETTRLGFDPSIRTRRVADTKVGGAPAGGAPAGAAPAGGASAGAAPAGGASAGGAPVGSAPAGSEVVDIVLRTCPFASLAATDPVTVCELHLGLAEGVIASAGGAEVEGLHIADPFRGGCRITVRRTRAEAPPVP